MIASLAAVGWVNELIHVDVAVKVVGKAARH
jgi:hypothetical protein